MLLLVHETDNYGSTTPLQLAVLADHKEFVAHAACQEVLTTIWFGRIDKDHSHMHLKVVPDNYVFFV